MTRGPSLGRLGVSRAPGGRPRDLVGFRTMWVCHPGAGPPRAGTGSESTRGLTSVLEGTPRPGHLDRSIVVDS
jgi:hypothetical protein